MANLLIHQVKSEIAKLGFLRVGINLSNTLLVTGGTPEIPEGVAPDLAAHIALEIDSPLKLVPFATPKQLTEAAQGDLWDIGFVGADPQRAKFITFTDSYVEIQASYLVRHQSHFQHCDEVDIEGIQIVSYAGAAYDLWLQRNLQHAKLENFSTFDESILAFETNTEQKYDTLASIKPKLLKLTSDHPEKYRILDGKFMAVQQAVGTLNENQATIDFLQDFISNAKQSGLVEELIEKHGAHGLSVAP